ncbi:MAG: hypothetical protein HOQ05_06055 [Corynebacteriales bacterium]|nr:hypothetical protein [Mycobacteriales bacterium]
MKLFGYLFGALAAASAAVYLLIYLYRWEWQRAVMSGVLLLIVEVFLVCMVLASRLFKLERQLSAADARAQDARRRLDQTRFDAGIAFQWLSGPTQDQKHTTHVFVPMLMAAGIILAGASWLAQKIGSSTGQMGAEQRLAGRLAGLTAPVVRPYGATPQLEDTPPVPTNRPGRRILTAFGALVAIALFLVLLTTLSRATKTKKHDPPDAAASVVVFEILTRHDNDRTRAVSARNLWERCSLSMSRYPQHTDLSQLDGAIYIGVLRPALSQHDLMRLRGCLSDAQANRAAANVLGWGQADHD